MAPLAGQRFAGAARRLGLEPQEFGTLLLMGALVAVLFCGYTIAKVLRDALFLAEYGALALPYAYIGVAFSSAGFVWLEGRIERRFSRVGATRVNQYMAIAFSAIAAIAYRFDHHWTTLALYLWTGSQAMLLLSHFWVLALDVWDSRRARRLFPWLSGCGLIGGLAGGGIAAWITPLVKRVGLIWTLTGLLIIAHLLTLAVEHYRRNRPRPIDSSSSVSRWDIVRRSSYIKVFVAGLALSVVVSTLIDFQFKYFIQRTYPDPHTLAEFLGKFYFGLNALALVFQFGVAGWLLQRIGLGASTGLQPTTVLLFASWMAIGSGGWVIIVMRWVQGVVFQTLGKSSSEIYYAAIRPSERRRIKPAIDTLVERWSDAAVGVLLIVALHFFHVPIPVIAMVTAALAAIWLAVLLGLDRQYGHAFANALSRRWIEPEEAAESMRIPAARHALLEALGADDERRLLLALELSGQARDPAITEAVLGALRHSSPAVRAAALQAMETARLTDRNGLAAGLVEDPNESVRRAAIGYLLSCGPAPAAFARRLLEGDDPVLRRCVVDALLERPAEAAGALTPEWVDLRLQSTATEDRLLAARALGALRGGAPMQRLRTLLADPDLEIRRAALQSATRRPNRGLLDDLMALLLDPDLAFEARQAIVAIGDPAVPALQRLLSGAQGPEAQAVAARSLAELSGPRAALALMPLVRGGDVWLRHLGLQALARMRLHTKHPVLSRSMTHRMFLRELRDYRACLEPANELESHPAREVRLLAESYRESAEMALGRALQALACWYEPRPLFGTFERLRARELEVASPALEYLSHILPGALFRSVSRVFERPSTDVKPDVDEQRVAKWIHEAWASDDAWLRACAVRASRHVPAVDAGMFVTNAELPAIVSAEIAARERRAATQPGGIVQTADASRAEPQPC